MNTTHDDRDFLEALRAAGALAVIRARSADSAVDICAALLRGGITAMEVTFSTPDAARAIRRVAEAHPEALLGAGTVLTPTELAAAVDAGAEFLVSPHLDEALLAAARDRGIPFLPGAFTATEAVRASRAGAAAVKLFPADAIGPSYLRALRAPLPHIPFVPTGGVNEHNLAEWLSAGALAVGLGGALITGSLAQVEASARRVSAAVATARGGGDRGGA